MEQKTITYEEFFTPGFFKFAFFPHSFFNSLRGLVVQRSMSVFENRKCHPPQAIKFMEAWSNGYLNALLRRPT